MEAGALVAIMGKKHVAPGAGCLGPSFPTTLAGRLLADLLVDDAGLVELGSPVNPT